MSQKLTLKQEIARASWQYRAIEATRGNQSKLGCIMIRLAGQMSKNPPRYDLNTTAHITAGGLILADFQVSPSRPFLATNVGTVSEFVTALRRLADQLKLTDAERADMTLAARNWIGSDDRAASDPQLIEDRLKKARRMN